MKEVTLCYIRQNGAYLMLYRNKKKNDPNEGKWIGIGGKVEPLETPDQCILREVREETDLTLTDCTPRGVVYFHSDCCDDEKMYLFSATSFQGTLTDSCNEGELAWISEENLFSLPMWEGDRVFLEPLIAGEKWIELALYYSGDTLVKIERENPC